MHKIFLVSIFLLFISLVHSQKIKGTIKDSSGNLIPRANILIKNKKNSSEISEFFISDDKGKFSFQLSKVYSNIIFLEISALGFEKTIDSISYPIKTKIYNFNISLLNNTTQLDKVFISTRKKYTIKKDTVVFNTQAYTDGTESKIEDLIKKLPGMEVGDNGAIKYNGKSVQALKLDGDDLFGYNYTIGTKNISIDMVDQIEAIENYSKNPLLKDIENSDNVAINLKLKKGKVDYSGTGNVGYGYHNKPFYDITTTILGVAKSFKSFGTLSYNNIGNNQTPFDYFSNSTNLEDIENERLYAKNIINNSPLNSVLSNSRTRLNNEWFGNYNFIFKFSPNLRIKSNIYYVNDKFFREELIQNDFLINSERIKYTDFIETIKKPINRRMDLNLIYNISKKSLLEVETSISKKTILSNNIFTRNLESSSLTKLRTDNFFWLNKLEYTNKLNDRSALQYKFLYSINNSPQEFTTIGNFTSDRNLTNPYIQLSENKKRVIQNHIILLGKSKKFKYVLIGGVDYFVNPFYSSTIENSTEITDFQNNFDYEKISYFSQLSSTYRVRKLKLETSLGFNKVFQELENNLDKSLNLKESVFYPISTLKVTYDINTVSKLKLAGSYEQQTPKETFLFPNNIIINNRSVKKNRVSLDTEKLQNYSLSYGLNDLAKNIEIDLIAKYSNKKNSFLPNINVNSNFTEITYFQSPINLDDYLFSFSVERYFRFLRTNLLHSSSYTISNFKNIVNQSEFRNNNTKSYNASLLGRTAFRVPINFENEIHYTIISYEISNQSKNTNKLIKNSFRAIFKPNRKLLFTVTYDYFKPSVRDSEDFSFLDFEIKYKPKKLPWISGRLIGKNLLDNRVFKQVENSDFSTTLYQSNLIPRYIMLSLNMRL